MSRIPCLVLTAMCLVATGCNSPNSTPETDNVVHQPIVTTPTSGKPASVPANSLAVATPGDSGNRSVTTITDKNGKKIIFTQVEVKYRPPAPPYPPEAKSLGIQGVVKVMLVVGPDGVPIQAKATEGPKELAKDSEIYAMAWRFYPALLDGVPQYARFIINLPYKLIPKEGNAP